MSIIEGDSHLFHKELSIQPHIMTALAVTAGQWGKSAWPVTASHSPLLKQFAKLLLKRVMMKR
jgi:hypothetical protein